MHIWALLLNCVERNSHKPESLLAEPNFFYIILSHLLLSLEMARRLCRRVISEALPAIFPYKKAYIKTYKKNIEIPLGNPLLKSVSCVPPLLAPVFSRSPHILG